MFRIRRHPLNLVSLALFLMALNAQAGKTDPSWPKVAVCVVCATGDPKVQPEPVNGASVFEGKTYYFCNASCKAQFDTSPYTYIMPPLPRPAGLFTLPTLAGADSVSLAGRKGSWTLIDFWATWCAPCKSMTDDLIAMHNEFAPRNFSVMSVAIDEDGPKKALAYVTKKKVPYPSLYDGTATKVWEEWKAAGLPSLYLVDPSGTIVAQWRGAVDMKKMKLEISNWLTEVMKADSE